LAIQGGLNSHIPLMFTSQTYHSKNNYYKNKSDISYLKTSRAFDVLSDPLRQAKLCWLATLWAPWVFSCSLLVFPLSVNLAPSRLCCLCFSVPISKS